MQGVGTAYVASHPPCFRLPTDVWLHIFERLVPIGILMLARTCRHFYSLAHSRTLWVKILHLTCERYGLFKPTFPMDKMTLLELQHAASTPSRFLRFMTHSDEMALPVLPFQTRVHPFRAYADSDCSPHNVSWFYLVPGGRFLVTYGFQEINLWDLGYNSRQYLEPLPLSVDDVTGHLLAVAPTRDGRELLVLTESGNDLEVYQIDPTSHRPEFRLVRRSQLNLPEVDYHSGELGYRPTIGHARLTNKMALIWRSPYFICWNWAENVGCKWRSTVELGYQPKMHMSDSSIIVCDIDEWRVWDVPTSKLSPQFPVIQNGLRLVEDFPDLEGGAVWMATQYWPTSSNEERICIITEEFGSSSQTFRTYLIQDHQGVAAGSGDTLLSAATIHEQRAYEVSEEVDIDEWDLEFKWGKSHLCGATDNIAFCTRSKRDELVVGLLWPPGCRDTAVFRRMTGSHVTTRESDFVEEMVGFCSASGRLVYMAKDNHGVFISDYLRPPA